MPEGRDIVAALAIAGLAGCNDAAPPVAPLLPRADAIVWEYDVRSDAAFGLDVEATFRAPVTDALRVDDDARPFLERVELETNGRFAPVDPASVRCSAVCRVRYHLRLREAAEALKSVDTAIASGGGVFAPPSTWLLRPTTVPAAGRYRFHVAAAPGTHFATGVRLASAGPPDTYEADVGMLEEASFAGFGALRVQRVAGDAANANAGIFVAAAPGLAMSDEAVGRWARTEVDAITAYLRHPPSDRAVLFFVPGTQDINRGKTLGDGGASVFIRVGTATTPANMLDDWVVAHELVHVGSPSVEPANNWFLEGMATYVEPIARVRAGLQTPEKMWRELVDGLPQGVPKPGDEGLVGATDFGRVYWGGALYFLLADLTIREASHGAKSVDDALAAWVAAGGTTEAHWTLEKTLDEGDRATGTRIFHELFDRFGRAPGTENLDALWARLGVRKDGKTVVFDDAAPLAKVRAAITMKMPSTTTRAK